MGITVARVQVWRLAIILSGALLCVSAQAQSLVVQVIPEPKQVTAAEGSFALRDARVVLADSKSPDDRFAAQDFIDDVKAAAGGTLSLTRGGRKNIVIGRLDSLAVAQALKRMNATVPATLGEEGYVVFVSADEVIVAGNTAAGTFYGLQTLKQLVRGDGASATIPGVKIVDWPTMRWRGVSDDISRGPVPTVDYIKRQIRTEAYFKMNMHSFYMEHTFSSQSHPLIGPEGGSLTPAEIKELVAYARNYHVELVPEQQTFGHLHKALRLEKYADLAETPYGDVLSPQQQGSYQLVQDWYKELNDLFPGQFFHIGEDETFELGEGQSKAEAQAKGVGAVYFEHLNRVRDLLKPYNKKLMFWGDIALHHPDLIGSVPKDMIVMNWQYGARDDFNTSIKPFQDAGLQQFVCPGAQTWNQIFPNTEAAAKNIINFVRDGQKAGAIGMMNTTWDDDGESLFEMSWYPMGLGAAASWQDGALNRGQFDQNFAWSFYRAEGSDLQSINVMLGSAVTMISSGSTTDDLFWRDPFTTQFINQARTNADKIKQFRINVENAQELLIKNTARVRRNKENLPALSLAARRFDHLGRRYEVMQKFSDQYWDAYLNLGDRTKARRLRYYTGAIYNNLREMAEELSILKEDYRKQWLAENRPYWLESILARYDQMILTWLNKSRAMDEALRKYEATSTLPPPEEFGLGARPVAAPSPGRQ
ncbi:MAG TPA: glycoside hydrolase family 20 zincin-like fold domain-containing protein [Pyrinomonadaceae bacterium]|nr:glycoside hydrolase family 20 zincin-like fold domain-containing protein [Pyrinomonadaceae bacterium]